MTKNELIDIINKKIDEYTNKRIEKLKKLEKEYSNHSQHMEAFMYHFIQNESLSMKAGIESELNDLIQSLDLGVDNSLYKERWENLKNYIKERERSINEDIKLCTEGANYGTAYTCQMHRDELQNIAYEMEYIERNTKYIERGIE